MANYEDTLVKQVTVNVLTKEQYNNLTEKDANQFYLTTDEEESYTQSESDSKYATKSELSEGLGTKQDKGDYATNTALTDGLNTKVNIDQGIDNKDKVLVVNSEGKLSISNNKLNDYATAANLNAHKNNTSNPHSVTKAQVGLGNVDNTSDANKPISTATQTALDLKADKSTTYTKTEIDNAKANKAVPTATGNVAKLNADGDLIDGGALGKLAVKDTISSNDIADNAIISSKIKDSAVGSSKIIDGAITNSKIAENAAISISKVDSLQESLDSKLNIDQGIENYRKIVSVDNEGLLTLIDNENLSVDGIGLLFEEKMFPIPIDDVRLVPLNNPGQTTGALYEGFDKKYPDAWNILSEAKAKAIAGEPGYERYNKTQAEYDAELLRTTIYDTDGTTVLKMGFCGFFVINDDGSVRFPFKGDAFDRGQVNDIDVDTLDQIRNITGGVASDFMTVPANVTNGAFIIKTPSTPQYGNLKSDGKWANGFNFDASKVVPTGIENQPRAQGKFYYLVLANAVDAISEVKLRDSIDAYVNNTTLPYIDSEADKWVDNVRNVMGTFISSARNNVPYGTLRCDGASQSDELGLEYNDKNFPDLYDALIKGNLKSVSIDIFDDLVAKNGWCGVFGLQEEKDVPSVGYYAWINGSSILYTTVDEVAGGIIVYNADLSIYRNDKYTYIAVNDQGNLFLSHEKESFANHYRSPENDIAGEIIHLPASFKTPKITNESQQNVIPSNDGSNKNLGRVLVKSQEPTVGNSYQWYNLYNDGWVEQGGKSTSAGTTITLPIRMANDSYTITSSYVDSTSANNSQWQYMGIAKTTTTITPKANGLAQSWYISGYADSSILEKTVQSNDNFFIQCYNTNQEISLIDFENALDEYADKTIKPELEEYADNLKPELEIYVNESKKWAISDEIIDEINRLYSAKHYAEQAEKNSVGLPILWPHWSDRILNDARWLRADTFSWQSGDIYVAAYNHLVNDYNNRIKGNAGDTGDGWYVDTINGIKINYVIAPDGHKIAVTNNEASIHSLYESTGVAWYYILDRENKQFKLPRTKFGFTGLRDSVGGYIEAGLPNIEGRFAADIPDNHSKSASGAFSGAAYTVSGMTQKMGTSVGQDLYGYAFNASRSNSIYGKSTTVQSPATQMYLYFYVGNYIENQDMIDVGVITEKLNELDLGAIENRINQATSEAIDEIDDYTDNTIKPGLTNGIDEYVDNTVKPDLNTYVTQAKNWATSDTVVDSANSLYSSKYYSNQSKNYMNQAKNWATSSTVVDSANNLYSAKYYADRAADIAYCTYQPIRYVNLTAGGTTAIALNDYPITICQGNGAALTGGSSYIIKLSLEKSTTTTDCWTYEVHLQIGTSLPTITWQTSDNKSIRWMSYSPNTPQLTNTNAMFIFRNQGGLLIGNYAGAY